MKIYEIATGYTPVPAQVPAATESIVEELTKAFILLKEDVQIIDIAAQKRAATDLPILEVKVPAIFQKADVSLGLLHKLKRVVYSVLLAFRLKKLLKQAEEKIVLHFHNQYNAFFFFKLTSKKLRSKAVLAYTNHNGVWSLPLEEAYPMLKKRYFQELYAMQHMDVNFVLNKKMQENVIQALHLPQNRVPVIDNGVNVELYHPLLAEAIAAAKEAYGLAGKRVILQVGSVNENKGQGRSLAMLAPLLKAQEDLVFCYAGDVVSEEYRQSLQQQAAALELQDKVIYLGAISPGQAMNEVYNLAEVTLFPSKYESFGLVCIESMAAGVPVLLGQNALDFGQGSLRLEEATASAQVEAVLNTELAELKAKARETAQTNYVWTKIAKDYGAGFEQA